jgi:hypothetical protein
MGKVKENAGRALPRLEKYSEQIAGVTSAAGATETKDSKKSFTKFFKIARCSGLSKMKNFVLTCKSG